MSLVIKGPEERLEFCRRFAQSGTLLQLNKIGSYVEVGWGWYKVSMENLVSFGYTGCRAVVLKNCNSFALSHIYPNHDPACYLEGMLEGLGTDKGIKAILVSGSNFKELEARCCDYGIEVVDSYNDASDLLFWHYKDVLVRPSLAEVKVFTATGEEEREIVLTF